LLLSPHQNTTIGRIQGTSGEAHYKSTKKKQRKFAFYASRYHPSELHQEEGVEDEMAKKLGPHEPRNLALAADLELEDAWRVEYFDSDGAGYITIFTGQSAELRARDYYDAIERGALNTRIADAQVMTAKPVVPFPQKRRRRVR
jgi:hypothetical protein